MWDREMIQPEQIAGDLADRLERNFSRRSFIGRLGRLVLALSGASLLEVLEMTAPSKSALASHCYGHDGPLCANNGSCGANTDSCGKSLVAGGYWTACCSKSCSSCADGVRYLTKFIDCCSTSCGAYDPCTAGERGYCSTGQCARCSRAACTTSVCQTTPRCTSPEQDTDALGRSRR